MIDCLQATAKAALAVDKQNVGGREIKVAIAEAAQHREKQYQEQKTVIAPKSADSNQVYIRQFARKRNYSRKPRFCSENYQNSPARQSGTNFSQALTIYVSNLPFSCTEADLNTLFESLSADIKEIRLAKNSQDGKCRGFAYIEFKSEVCKVKIKVTHSAQHI